MSDAVVENQTQADAVPSRWSRFKGYAHYAVSEAQKVALYMAPVGLFGGVTGLNTFPTLAAGLIVTLFTRDIVPATKKEAEKVSPLAQENSRLIGGVLVATAAILGVALSNRNATLEAQLEQREAIEATGPQYDNSNVIFSAGFDEEPADRIFRDVFEGAAKAKTCEDPDVIFSGGFGDTLPKCKLAPKP